MQTEELTHNSDSPPRKAQYFPGHVPLNRKPGYFNYLKVNPMTAMAARVIGRSVCSTVKSYVFVANTGRCGTMTLSKIFSAVPKSTSVHEPHPMMSGKAMLSYNYGQPNTAEKIFRERKLPNIYWTARGADHYMESNHMFIKVFAEFAAREFGKRMKVVYLYRNKYEVASSYYNRHTVSEYDLKNSENYILNPVASKNIIKVIDLLHGEFSNLFFHYVWYCYETEARTRKFARDFPHIKVHGIRTEDLNSVSMVSDLLNKLEIPVPENLGQIVGVRLNRNKSASEIPDGIDMKSAERFCALCEERMNEAAPNLIT